MTSEKLSNETEVCYWLGIKPTQDNRWMVEETITRFLCNEEEDGKSFNEVERTEFEILNWVVDHLDRQHEYGDAEDEEGRKVIAFTKKALKSLWKKYRANSDFRSITEPMEQHGFIEKIIFEEKAKTLPEGTTTWSMDFKSKSGRTITKHYAVKNGKWVRV